MSIFCCVCVCAQDGYVHVLHQLSRYRMTYSECDLRIMLSSPFGVPPPSTAVLRPLDQEERPPKKHKQQSGPFKWLAGENCLLKERGDEQDWAKQGDDYSSHSESRPTTPLKKKREKSVTVSAWYPDESCITKSKS